MARTGYVDLGLHLFFLPTHHGRMCGTCLPWEQGAPWEPPSTDGTGV